MTVSLVADVAVPERAEHAEGPLWDDRTGELLWVDQYRGIVHAGRPLSDGTVLHTREFSIGSPVGAVVLNAGGGWMLAAADGFLHLAPDGTVSPISAVLPDDGIRRRMNDGKVDLGGRFWAGSMAFDKTEGAGALYVLDHGRVTTALDGVTISNGLAWTATGSELFYIDTPTAVIRRFTVAEGTTLTGETAVVDAPDGGAFDGMCIDTDGCLWVALWGAGAVHQYSPEGELRTEVSVDAPQVSSCAFGGPELDTLYITTSREGYGPDLEAAHPHAGQIFTVMPGARGLPAERYRG